MGEQKINVKNTYVATVKKDVANSALSFYSNEKKEDVFSGMAAFPDTVNNASEVVVTENVAVPETVVPNKVEETITIPQELNVDTSVKIEVPTSVEETTEPVKTDELSGIPNLTVLNPIPETPVNVTPESNGPSVEPMANPIPMPSVPPVDTPAPIPNPVPQPTTPTPIDTFSSIDNMVNQVSQNAGEAPIRFDASQETNLLGALSDNSGQAGMGNIPVTPDNLNVVREFGVDEPVVTDNNGAPVGNSATGFVNSKILLILVIVFFLASCVFLGYEIYKYVTLPK